MAIIDTLTFKQKLSWCNHLRKALTVQYHKDLITPFARYIKADSVVLDIGANAGQFTKLLSRLAPDGTVYALEPSSYALSILHETVRIKGLKNVNILPFGTSAEAGEFTLNVPVKPSGALGYAISQVGNETTTPYPVVSETITVETLDALFPDTQIDFIKADIEGHEYEMLCGAKDILKQSHPALYLEISSAKAKTNIQTLLKKYAYHPCDIATGQAYDWDAFLNRTEDNYLFVAKP